MTVLYLKKATTSLVAVATPESEPDWAAPADYKVAVVVRDREDEPVFRASITMWVTPRR